MPLRRAVLCPGMRLVTLMLGLLLCMGTLSSCLGDNDDVELSHDCYISSVTLGQLRRSHHTTTAQGTDSVYYTAYSGTNYHVAIDQLAGTISNADSLLYNTVLEKMLINISASGTVIYRPENQLEEHWETWSSSDSVDVSGPVLLRVFSQDGSSQRDYRMTLNVRKLDPDGFSWNRMGWTADVAAADSMKAVWGDGVLMLMCGSKDGGTKVAYTRPDDSQPGVWATASAEGADAMTLTYWQGAFWASRADGRLVHTDGNMDWQVVETPFALRLLAAHDTLLYAMSDDGRMVHAGPAMCWEEDGCDTPDMLPTSHAIGLGYATTTGGGRVMMVGRHGSDALATVWGKTVSASEKTSWVYYPWNGSNSNLCPALEGMGLTRYNSQLVAIGGRLEAAYISPDNGITWRANYGWELPELDARQPATIAADDKGRLWIVNGSAVYCGRAHTLKD